MRYFSLKTGREVDFVLDQKKAVEVKETPTQSDWPLSSIKISERLNKVVTPKMKVGDMVLFAYVADTEGNVIGLWQDLKKTQQ